MPDLAPQDVAEARGILAQLGVQDSHKVSGDDFVIMEMKRERLMQDIGAEASVFEAVFDGLPDVRPGLPYLELMKPPPNARPASSEDVEKFKMTRHGAILSKEWGSTTAHRLGSILARQERAAANWGDAEYEAYDGWFQRMPPGERAACLRVMVHEDLRRSSLNCGRSLTPETNGDARSMAGIAATSMTIMESTHHEVV